jgi:hypothetical protein
VRIGQVTHMHIVADAVTGCCAWSSVNGSTLGMQYVAHELENMKFLHS